MALNLKCTALAQQKDLTVSKVALNIAQSGENGRIGRSTFCRNFRFCRKPGAGRNYPTTQCTVASSQVPHHDSFFKATCQKSVGEPESNFGENATF